MTNILKPKQAWIDALDAASYRMDMAAPYMGIARAACTIVWTRDVPIGAIDMYWRMYLNPDHFLSQPVERAGCLLWHETCHPLRKHFERAVTLGVDPSVWNIGADAEIHDTLSPGLVMLPGGVTPALLNAPSGLLAEDYVQYVRRTPTHTLYDSGSGSDGQPKPWELPANDPRAPALTGAEAHALRVQVAEAIRDAAAGTVPGGLVVWADSLLKPAVPWHALLRSGTLRSIAGVGLGARTYTRVKERHGLMFPKYVRPRTHLALVIDCSGSMLGDGSSPFARALTEVHALLRIYGRLSIVWCDRAVTIQRNVTRLNLQPIGGGGTDMGVGIAAADGLRPAVECIVTITDGQTSWPAVAPKAQHITVLVGGATQGPPWGRTIVVPER